MQQHSGHTSVTNRAGKTRKSGLEVGMDSVMGKMFSDAGLMGSKHLMEYSLEVQCKWNYGTVQMTPLGIL